LSGAGLERREEQLAPDSLQLLANLDCPGVEVDVVPAQAESLAASQAVEDEHDERRVQRIGLGRSQELPGLGGRPGPDGTAFRFRQLGQAGDVAEAKIALGVVAARQGDLEQAFDYGERALAGERKSLPSLAMVSRDLTRVLRDRYPDEPSTKDYLEKVRVISQTRD